MALSIQQDAHYVGHDRWKWSVWLEDNEQRANNNGQRSKARRTQWRLTTDNGLRTTD